MRKLKLFSLLCLLLVGVGQVWADKSTLTFTAACGGTGTADDDVSWTVSSDGAESAYDGTKGIHYGTGKKAVQYIRLSTSGISGTISQVKVNASGASGVSATVAVKVGTTDFTTGTPASATASISATATDYTFTGSATGDILVDITKPSSATGALYCKSIEVTYSTGGGGSTPQPTVSSDPTSWDFGAVATDAAASKVFSVSGSDLEAGTLTLTAPSGYSVSPASISVASAGGLDATNVTVSKNTSTAGTYNGNLTISGCGLESAVNVALSMEVKAKYTVTWNNNGSTSTSQVIDGAKPVFPATPDACDAASTTFIGWATAPWTGKLANLDDKTVYTKAADMPAVTAAVTYYAVFAKSSGSAGNLFEWEGGTGSELTALENVTASGLGTDYAESNAPYRVKFDTEGDYIVITTSGAIESVAVGVKMLGGGNTSHIYVQEAEDAESDFSAVETLTINGAQNDVLDLETENAFKADSRAVKLLFNRGSNVGVGPITISGAASVSDYMTTCCTKYNVNIAAGIENGSVEADLAQACEGTTITLTFTPALNYHLSAWTLNGVAQDIAENTFEMPNEAVTVSATFAQDACDPLATPVVAVSGKAYPYNAVKLAWSAITNADSYKVYIYDNDDNELEHNDAVTGVEYTIGQALSASTTYKYSVQAISNTPATYCPSTEAESTFTTNALPTAHLTLIDLEGEHDDSGDYAILTPFNLPTTAASCAKTFMGWDPDDECATAPTYAKGAEFTFANTTGVTLYAVYADVTGGGTNTTNIAYSGSSTTNMVEGDNAETFGLDADEWSVVPEKGNNSNYPGLNNAGDIRLYYSAGGGNTLTITAPQTITSVGLTFTSASYNNAYVKVGGEAVELSDGVYPINATSFVIGNANTSNVQVRISNIAVNFTTPGTPSNYSTTCAAAPEVIVNPEEINATAAAVAAGVIEAAYDNVNEELISVALYNDEACTEDFDGGWLTADINGDKNIAYTIAENTSYNDARSAYIKLTAPASSTGVADAVVVIPVSQAKKAAVFASLEELVAADVNANTNVTVSFSNVVIKEIYMYNSNRRGLVFDIQKDAADIKIYFNADVPAAWTAGGKVSGTLTNCPWKIYSSAWQLAPASGWAWDNGDLTYTAPPAIASIEIREDATYKTYIDGQVFNPAGLEVIAIYDNSDEEDVTAYATWTFDPEKLSVGDEEVEVTAEYNSMSDTKTVDGLTVNPIPNKTIAQFIAAEGTRCYLEGIVSNITNTTYGNFDLTDASGSIYVYGCLTPSGESAKFNTLGVSAGDKIKVIAEEYLLYQKAGDPDKHEAKNVVFVSKKSPATMTFNPMALEFGDVETMAPATITLADASDIVYSIKDGSDDCVTIAGDQITAKSVAGTATIVATLEETTEYVGATVEFVVTVTAPITKYAITFDDNGADGGDAPEAIAEQAENAEVTLPANTWTKEGYKFDGWKVINNTTSAEVPVTAGKFSMPASAVTIQAQWAEIPSWAYVYDNNVVVAHTGSGTDDGTITISETAYKLVKAGAGSNTGTIKVTVPAGATDLHFHAFAWGGKTAKIQIAGVENASISVFDLAGEAGAAGSGNDFTLAGVPVDQYFHVSFDEVAEETEITFSKADGSADNRFFFYGVNQVGGNFGSYHRNVTSGNYGTICLPYAGTISGATLFEIAGYDGSMILCDEITDGKMKAGRPYIFKAAASQLTVDYTANIKTAAGSHNGLYGFYNLEDMATDDADQKALTQDAGNYILYQNAYWLVSGRDAFIYNFRAYIKLGEIENAGEPAPGRRRVAMAVHGEQVVTDIDAINASEKPMKLMIDGQLFILRGEKMFDATGRLVK